MTRIRWSYMAVAAAAVIVTGCSDSARQTLTAPTAIESGTALTAGIHADRTTSAGPANSGMVALWTATHGWTAAADGLVVEGTDSISAVSGSCPAKTITVRGVPVELTASTTFTAPVTCETLAVGSSVKVTALLTFTATGFTVTATNISSGDSSSPTSPTGTQVEGVVASFTGACPALTITLQGGGIVVTNSSTVFDPSTVCSQIAPGTEIEATGTRNAANELVATKVQLGTDEETPSGPGGGGKGKKASGEGVIGSITGSCPTLTLVITGTKVSTTASTTYEGGTCSSLRPGTKVKIDGELNPGGTATAEKIEIKSIPPGKGPKQRVSGDGKVDTVTGTCPALTLMVRGVTVTTSSETTFSGGVCGDIRSGSQIDVTGDYDGTEVVATGLHIKKK